MDAREIEKWFEDKEDNEFRDLFNRMDDDFELWAMTGNDSYSAEIKSKTKSHASDINIISNDLRTSCDDIQSTLASADRQIIVRMAEERGNDKRDEIGTLERLLEFAFEKADERLRRMLLPPLREASDWHSLVRGWRAGRFLVYKSAKSVIFDFMSWDPRWVVYDIGENGLLRVGYKTFRSASLIESEYKSIWEKIYGFFTPKKDDIAVIDYFESEKEGEVKNQVVSRGEILEEQVLKIPSMPVLIMPVSTRPPVSGAEGINLKGYGESIFAPVRHINAVHNRFASIGATHAYQLARQPIINYKTGAGKTLDSLIGEPEGVLNLTMGENRIEAVPTKELSPTFIGMMDWLNNQKQQGILPKMPMESPQPSSGTRYNLGEERASKIFNPQLRNLDNFYADICRLVEEQLIAGGIKVKIQGIHKLKYYEVEVKPVDLKASHSILVKHTAKTPWSQMDTAQVAQMLKGLGLPDGWIWENILKVQDPKQLADLVAIELYEHSPEGAMARAVEALMELRGDPIKAGKLAEKMVMLEQQERMAVQGQPTPQPTPEVPPMEG